MFGPLLWIGRADQGREFPNGILLLQEQDNHGATDDDDDDHDRI
jgi:hypothetical protein